MAPHLSGEELDIVVHKLWMEWTPKEIHRVIAADRRKKGIEPPKIWAIRRACQGATHRRARSETRGRKKELSRVQVKHLNDTRVRLLKEAKAQHEIPYAALLKRARIEVHRSTAARYLRRHFGVKWRRLREKPLRSKEHTVERKEICRMWKAKPASFWTNEVDLIIDCKKFPIPTSKAATQRLRSHRIRGALRSG